MMKVVDFFSPEGGEGWVSASPGVQQEWEHYLWWVVREF